MKQQLFGLQAKAKLKQEDYNNFYKSISQDSQ